MCLDLQLLAAMAQLLFIVAERLAFLYRSGASKALLHLTTVVIIHVLVFFEVLLSLGKLCASVS